MIVSEKYQKELKRIKSNVEKFNKWFKNNYSSFNESRKFVFKSTINDSDKAVLDALKKPQIEANILEAPISRLCGEFAKNEPSIIVSAQDGKKVAPEVLDFYEGHIRYILSESNNEGTRYNAYVDLLSGGFSGFKVITEYAHPMSFEQNIKLKRVDDPTLTGYDPLARLPGKQDGEYCFQCYPLTENEFKHRYPNIDVKNVNFSRNVDGYSWSYVSGKEKIFLVCDYYEKKKRKVKIVRLSNNKTMRKDQYKKDLFEFEKMGYMEQAPQIVDERVSEIVTIVRYRFIKDQVLEYVETDFEEFPLVYIDGNSVTLRENGGESTQITRSYIYNARGTQKLKNYALQTLANELENMVQHKWMIAKESIPIGYEKAYQDPQLPNVVVYNAFNNNNPGQPLPPPREVQRVPAPPEVTTALQLTDNLVQTILGSFDPQMGNTGANQMSGIAVIENASLNNAAAMPYIVNFLQGFNQAAQVIIKLIPKYYVTPRSVPIIDKEGRHKFVLINQEDGISLDHDEHAINVKVEAGVSFGIQKSRALQQIIALMQSSELFAQFINTEGLPLLLDNIEMRGADQLKSLATDWMQKMKQQQEQAQQQAQENPQPDPMQMQMQMMQMEQQLTAQKLQIAEQDLALKDKKIDIDAEMKAQQVTTERIKVLGQLEQEAMKNNIDLRKSDSEELHRSIDMALKTEKEMIEASRVHQE